MGAKKTAKAKRPPALKKLPLLINADLAKRLKLLAIERGLTLGALCSPALESLVRGFYVVDPSKAAPAQGSANSETSSAAVTGGDDAEDRRELAA